MNFPIWNYPYAACFASASLVLSPVFYLADKKLPPEGAWAFPLCSNAHAHFIVLSPVFYLADKKLPPEGASTLNLVAIVALRGAKLPR